MELIGRLNLIECLLEMDGPIEAPRKNRINALLDKSDKLLKPLASPQLDVGRTPRAGAQRFCIELRPDLSVLFHRASE